MSTSVKFITSAQRGAPVVNGVAGTQISAIDAFINGWGVTTALSVTVADGIATASLTPGETFDRTAVILVAGATPGEINGESRVLTSSNTSITWPTTAADGVATGTITIKYAPQSSWVKAFGATNKAAYKSTHVQASGHHLRVLDAGTTSARVVGYETMTDVDTGTGPFPTEAQMAGGGYWFKSSVASAAAIKWRIFADERFMLICNASASNSGALYTAAQARGFGDMIPVAAGGDVWSTALSCAGAGGQHLGSFDTGSEPGANNGGIFCPRAFSALGGSKMMAMRSFTGTAGAQSGSDTALGPAPSEIDGSIRMSPVFLTEGAATKPPRAIVPGIYYIPQSSTTSVLADGDILEGSGALAGRKLMVVHTATNWSTQASGAYLVDLTGPWR